MTNRLLSRAITAFLLIALATAPALAQQGGRDKKAPSKPTNLRITAFTPWSVSLAWGASTDNSGFLTYRVVCSNGFTMTLPQTQTSVTFTDGIHHQVTYSFYVVAIDGSNNVSPKSNTVTITLPKDVTPPSKPVISVTEAGPTHLRLAFASNDESPLVYKLFMNGNEVWTPGGPSAVNPRTIYMLQHKTAYSFTVQARDRAGNWSVMSDTLVASTTAPNMTDTEPPTAPGNLDGQLVDAQEFWFWWSTPTDNVTPGEFIRYEFYINGVFDGTLMEEQTFTYVTPGILNKLEVFAFDERGNRSVAAVLFIDMR